MDVTELVVSVGEAFSTRRAFEQRARVIAQLRHLPQLTVLTPAPVVAAVIDRILVTFRLTGNT